MTHCNYQGLVRYSSSREHSCLITHCCLLTPQPCLFRHVCRLFWEHSCFFRSIGSIGSAWGDRNRGYIMLSAFVCSFVAWILCFASIAATSYNGRNIENTAWAQWKVEMPVSLSPPSGYRIESFVGINARVDVKKNMEGGEISRQTVAWTDPDACDLGGYWYADCIRCGTDARGASQWMITGALTGCAGP
jgi:hypothetical protein